MRVTRQPAQDSEPPSIPSSADELSLVEALRRGDEAAFATLIDRYHASLLRLARIYVSSGAVAEEVVQETWLAVFQGLARFEGRSSLKTWIFRLLTNRAKTRGEREGRSSPFSDLEQLDAEPAVAPERFLPPDHPRWPGHWVSFPQGWDEVPESRLLSQETRGQIERAIAALPQHQQMVINLCDVAGWTAAEVCQLLGISETNQRMLLHRARSKVRGALEQYLSEGSSNA